MEDTRKSVFVQKFVAICLILVSVLSVCLAVSLHHHIQLLSSRVLHQEEIILRQQGDIQALRKDINTISDKINSSNTTSSQDAGILHEQSTSNQVRIALIYKLRLHNEHIFSDVVYLLQGSRSWSCLWGFLLITSALVQLTTK